MTPRESAVFAVTSKSVTGLAIAFLVVAAFLGFLNSQKVKAHRTNAVNAQAARNAAEPGQAQAKLNDPIAGTTGAEQQSKIAEAENRAAKTEAELAQVQKEKAALEAKLAASQQEIAALQKRGEETEKTAAPSNSPAAAAAQTADLQSQIDDLRRQLDSAEKEKVFLSEKLEDAQGRAAQPKEGKKRRETASTQGEPVSPHRTGV